MGGDYTRFTFDPEKNYAGVLKQQGRVDVDADWNEQVDIDQRRWRAETLDIMGTAVVPRQTTRQAFEIDFDVDGNMTIGPGRMYVHGILVENHGGPPLAFDEVLAENGGTVPVLYSEQPNFHPDPPEQDRWLIYLDVWQREVTALHDPRIREIALGGADTATRLQTVWQVKHCASSNGNQPCRLPSAITQPPQGRLSTYPVAPDAEDHPCLVKPAGGYRGLENRLYRVEIHVGGVLGEARFKWSRDNGSVASAVREIVPGTEYTDIVLKSLGRDQVLTFRIGDWVEVLDDHLELRGESGELARVQEIDEADQRIRVSPPIDTDRLSPGELSAAHTLVRRWDQGEAADEEGLIPVAGEATELEEGIRISFSTASDGGEFRVGDYWVFAARTADGSVELLEEAPPRGIHHHCAPLAVVDMDNRERLHECRIFWPPAMSQAEGCDCTFCVTAESHNDESFTIQDAVDAVGTSGGTVCLGAGLYWLERPVRISGARSLRIKGQGRATTIGYPGSDAAIQVNFSIGVTIEELSIIIPYYTPGGVSPPIGGGGGFQLSNSMETTLRGCTVTCQRDLSESPATGPRGGPAVAMEGILIQTRISGCTLMADNGLQIFERRYDFGSLQLLLSYGLYIEDNYVWCDDKGIDLKGFCLHFGETRISGNFVRKCQGGAVIAAGLAFGGSGVDIKDNEFRVSGHGIVAGSNNMRISDNDISPESTEINGDGIVLDVEIDFPFNFIFGALDLEPLIQDYLQVAHHQITNNRILGVTGDGIAIRSRLRSAIIEGNIIERAGRNGICMYNPLGSNSLTICNNQILNIASDLFYPNVYGMRLLNADHIDIVGNKIMGVGQTTGPQAPQRFGIQIVACLSQKIAGNEITRIGPEAYAAESAGIQILAPFEHTEIMNNVVRWAASAVGQNMNWIALQIKLPADYQLEIADGILLRLGSDANGNIYLFSVYDENPITTFSEDARQMTVQANRFEVRGGRQAVDIVGRGTCLFNNNRCRSQTGDRKAFPAVNVEAEAIVANANFIASQSAERQPTAMRLVAEPANVTVLGNITDGGIQVGEAGLGTPWNNLNVIKS